MKTLSIVLTLLFYSAALGFSAETESGDYPGLTELRLVTDATSVQPGEPITVGLWIRHAEDFHTYWKNPGIVGIATMFDWKLPEGWTASEITWPTPQKTIMATLTAWGHEGDGTCLLATLTPPKTIEGSEVALKTRVGWMACARTCHPGWHDFELKLPVSNQVTEPDEKWATVFQEARAALPQPIPKDWAFSLTEPAKKTEGEFTLTIESPEPLPADQEGYLFSYDNQIDSDSPQTLRRIDDRTLELTLIYPSFAPSQRPDAVTGLIHLPGWEGEFFEISVPW